MCDGISKFSFISERFGKSIVILSMARQEMLVLKSLNPEKILMIVFLDTELTESPIPEIILFRFVLSLT